MILEQLKIATRPYHEAMERDPLSRSLLSPAISHDDYVHILQVYLGFYAPLEQALFSLPDWAKLGFDIERRRKAGLLLHDLRALGASTIDANDVLHCSALPPVVDLGVALGCMYVLEGATLGGQLIARHLGRRSGSGRRAAAPSLTATGLNSARAGRSFALYLRPRPLPLRSARPLSRPQRQPFWRWSAGLAWAIGPAPQPPQPESWAAAAA